MKIHSVIRRLVGLGLLALGSVIWSTRLDYNPEAILSAHLGSRLISVDHGSTTDLSKPCNVFTDEAPWILFALDANLFNDDIPRTYFTTTTNERQALWVEYDPPLLRVGLGLGEENSEANTEIPLRVVRRDSRETIVIVVKETGTRAVLNATNRRSPWPDTPGGKFQCDAVQIGIDSHSPLAGVLCKGCDINLRYATGVEKQEIDALFVALDNTGRFNLRRLIGQGLSFMGLILLLTNLRVKLRNPRQTDQT